MTWTNDHQKDLFHWFRIDKLKVCHPPTALWTCRAKANLNRSRMRNVKYPLTRCLCLLSAPDNERKMSTRSFVFH